MAQLVSDIRQHIAAQILLASQFFRHLVEGTSQSPYFLISLYLDVFYEGSTGHSPSTGDQLGYGPAHRKNHKKTTHCE